jgi:hypothetical protein
MRLFRSGEEPRSGATVDLETLQALARRWYGDRLAPGWGPRSLAESQAILTEVGLTGGFWALSR